MSSMPSHMKTREVAEGSCRRRGWILRIPVNTAITRGEREARSVPFSSTAPLEEGEPSVEPERFRPPGEAFAGHWDAYPGDWRSRPEESLQARETIEVVKSANG